MTGKLSDWRSLWRLHGGNWHGPHVEQWTIPEKDFCNFMDAALASPAPENSQRKEVKPLDLSNLLQHAFLSGVVAAKNRPAHESYSGPALWAHYDPGGSPAYARILSALETDQ